MLIIRPRFFLSSDGRTVFDKRYGVVRFNSNDWSQKASSKLQNGWGLELLPIPALLTRMSRLPIDSSAFWTTFLCNERLERSAEIATAVPPDDSISLTKLSSSSVLRAVTAIRAPSAANPTEIARPMPRPAPVTRAVLSLSFEESMI